MSRPYLVVLAAFALAACDRPTAPVPRALKPGASVSFSKANTTKTNDWFDVSGFAVNDCNNDIVTLSGRAHEVFTVTDNGTSLDFKVHINYDDLKGVGDPSGAQYHLNAAENVKEIDFSDFTYAGRIVLNEELVSQGSEPNLIIHITEYYSWDGTTFTVTDRRFSIECRG